MAGRPRTRARRNNIIAAVPSSDAFERLKRAGVECGIDQLAMEQLVVRLQGRPPSAEGRLKLDDAELLALIDDKLARAFQNLDDFALGQSSARDLSVTIGVLTDKREALKPEEGALTKFQDMRKLDELASALNEELKRRGKLVDVTPDPAAAPVAGRSHAPEGQ